ncbi:MAG: YegS/Rv2252/BmrU family lipid kinase [Flavobacteriales bacterium]|nr:YegS/Rv2252/BmrU family lipid kinase [Flavobacteriales bacterium]
MAKKIAFVVNQGSRPNRNINYEQIIFNSSGDDATIVFWENIHQVANDVAKLIEEGFEIIAAIGGDGTISYITGLVVNTDVALCVIPMGSGNGLARHLGIPLQIENALALLQNSKIIEIDAVSINGRKFFCTAGVGFDTHLGNIFANSKERGFATYVKLSIRELFSFKSKKYKIKIGDKIEEVEAFLISICNSAQYGNDVFIAPQANISDGIADVVVLKPFSFFQSLYIFYLLKTGKIQDSKYIQTYKGKVGEITFEGQDVVHFDGEIETMGPKLCFEVNPNSLKVLVPN